MRQKKKINKYTEIIRKRKVQMNDINITLRNVEGWR